MAPGAPALTVRHFAGAILLRGRALVDGKLCAEGRITLKPPR
jgi:hypothetical protein